MSIKQNSRALIIHAVLLFGCDANEQPHAAEQPPASTKPEQPLVVAVAQAPVPSDPRPHYRVVLPAPTGAHGSAGQLATLHAAQAWNVALGYTALQVVPSGSTCDQPTDVCVSIVDTLGPSKAGWTHSISGQAPIFVDIAADGQTSPNFYQHELGHVLSGDEHSTDRYDVMYAYAAASSTTVGLTQWDVDHFQIFNGLDD